MSSNTLMKSLSLADRISFCERGKIQFVDEAFVAAPFPSAFSST